MKRIFLTLTTLLLLFMLVLPASVTAQDDELEVTLFVTEDGAYSVALLEGWAATGNEEDGLSVANSQETLDTFDTDQDPGPGDFGIRLLALPTAALAEFGLEEDASLVDVLTAFVPLLGADEEEPVEIGEVTEMEFAGRPAATVVGTSANVEAQYVFYILAPETLGIGFVGGAPGILAEMGELGLEILATARYRLPLTETFESELVTFNYPAEWVAEDQDGAYIVTNDPEAVDADALEEGQYGIILFDLGMLGVTGDSVGDVAFQVGEFLREEDQEYSEPIEVDVHEITVGIVDVTSPETEGNEGGIFVIETEDGYLGAVFVTPHGQSYQMGLTALSILLSIE